MTIQEEIELYVKQQGNQVGLQGLAEILLELASAEGQIGNLAELLTDHKSSITEALNELADAVETSHYEISMLQSNAERKLIYEEIVKHKHLAKNIVFYNAGDAMYYKTNGYNVVNNVLHLHTIMKIDGQLQDIIVQVGSNGAISIV